MGGPGPGLSLWKPPPHTDNHSTGSLALMIAASIRREAHGTNLEGFIHSFRGSSVFERQRGLRNVNICATSVMMLPCYTTPPLTSRLPFLLPLIGRGTQTDSGEPLLWQLPPERRTQGQPDICQWPAQSDRAWQKPIRWDATARGMSSLGDGTCLEVCEALILVVG